MAKYWIGVASREHVKRGVKEGIMQVCHGKGAPLKRMCPSDKVIYYSSKEFFGKDEPCQKFTALGTVADREPYQFEMSPDFTPWRRDIKYAKVKEVAIKPLLAKLSFIQNKQRWGFPFRRGCFEITEADFKVIANAMGIKT
jgi:predicted RNA-binding protein